MQKEIARSEYHRAKLKTQKGERGGGNWARLSWMIKFSSEIDGGVFAVGVFNLSVQGIKESVRDE